MRWAGQGRSRRRGRGSSRRSLSCAELSEANWAEQGSGSRGALQPPEAQPVRVPSTGARTGREAPRRILEGRDSPHPAGLPVLVLGPSSCDRCSPDPGQGSLGFRQRTPRDPRRGIPAVRKSRPARLPISVLGEASWSVELPRDRLHWSRTRRSSTIADSTIKNPANIEKRLLKQP